MTTKTKKANRLDDARSAEAAAKAAFDAAVEAWESADKARKKATENTRMVNRDARSAVATATPSHAAMAGLADPSRKNINPSMSAALAAVTRAEEDEEQAAEDANDAFQRKQDAERAFRAARRARRVAEVLADPAAAAVAAAYDQLESARGNAVKAQAACDAAEDAVRSAREEHATGAKQYALAVDADTVRIDLESANAALLAAEDAYRTAAAEFLPDKINAVDWRARDVRHAVDRRVRDALRELVASIESDYATAAEAGKRLDALAKDAGVSSAKAPDTLPTNPKATVTHCLNSL